MNSGELRDKLKIFGKSQSLWNWSQFQRLLGISEISSPGQEWRLVASLHDVTWLGCRDASSLRGNFWRAKIFHLGLRAWARSGADWFTRAPDRPHSRKLSGIFLGFTRVSKIGLGPTRRRGFHSVTTSFYEGEAGMRHVLLRPETYRGFGVNFSKREIDA